jgi:hypothetical protein
MPLVQVVIVLIAVGVGLYLINNYVTIMDAKIKKILNWVVIVVVIIWLLSLFFPAVLNLGGLTVGKVR